MSETIAMAMLDCIVNNMNTLPPPMKVFIDADAVRNTPRATERTVTALRNIETALILPDIVMIFIPL